MSSPSRKDSRFAEMASTFSTFQILRIKVNIFRLHHSFCISQICVSPTKNPHKPKPTSYPSRYSVSNNISYRLLLHSMATD